MLTAETVSRIMIGMRAKACIGDINENPYQVINE